MHDSEEITAPFTFTNGDLQPITVPAAILVYDVYQQQTGGQPPIKLVTTGGAAVFDLFPATPAEIAATFPAMNPLPTNAVIVAGKGPTSPTGIFFVRATASPANLSPVTRDSATFPVTRDPSVPVGGNANPLSTPRPRTHA